MKLNTAILFLTISVFCIASATAQDTSDYYNPSFLRYENHVYKTNIKTVILERVGAPLSDPVIQLKQNEKLLLSFDDLDDKIKDYSYRWIHCTSSWEASNLLSESDFVDGFYTDHISTFHHSFNTLTPYFHYELEFPNDQMRPLLSGNYLLVVYENDFADVPVITQRFWVVESQVEVQPFIHRATEIELRNSHQEVDFKLMLNKLQVSNPYADIKVSIVQNNRWASAITNLKPMFALDGVLDYNYEEGNIFDAGNEFRNCDLRATRFQTQFTEQIIQDSITQQYIFLLKPEIKKSSMRYSSEEDINGRFLIKIYDNRDASLEADYVKVKFHLPVEENDSGNIYLFGQLSDWNLVSWAKMTFNNESNMYEQTLMLKQGYYNYEYIFLPVVKSAPVIADTEGNHYETENDYSFFIYWKETGGRYDKLIGYRKVNSRQN